MKDIAIIGTGFSAASFSYFVIETIFRLSWSLEIVNSALVLLLIGIITVVLILFNNYRFLSPKVYPLVRNE